MFADPGMMICEKKGDAACTALVVLMLVARNWITVPAAGFVTTLPHTSQSPAVRLMLVMFPFDPEVNDTAVPVAVTNSPTLPAFALLFVVVPTMPFVCEGVKLPVLLSVVNAPVFAAVLPIEGGEANKFVNPVPLTAELAESVVNAPVFAAVLPMGGGDARKVVKPVPLTVELAASVVKLPVFGVVAPMLPFSAPPVELSVVKVPVDGVTFPTAVLLIPPEALNAPVCTHAPVPLVEVIPLTPDAWPPVSVSAFVKLVNASLAKPKARTVDPQVTNAFLLFALRIESMN